MQKLKHFFNNSARILVKDSIDAVEQLKQQIKDYEYPTKSSTGRQIIPSQEKQQLIYQNEIPQKPLENLELQQSKVISNSGESRKQIFSCRQNISLKQSHVNQSRVKEIEEEKRRIIEELRRLDSEILEIKNQSATGRQMEQSQFHKKIKIADDFEARKQAQQMIKQLNLQRKKMLQKKRNNQIKQLRAFQQQEEMRRRERDEMARRLKEEKRQQIEKRMSEEKRKKQERLQIQKQSNSLIAQLKRQQEQEKQKQMLPSQILQIQQKKKLLQKKANFDIGSIDEHQRKYNEFKSKEKQLRKQRSQSITVRKVPKYGKNIWSEKLQEEQFKKKLQQKEKEIHRKEQLQKRMRYGDVVKNMWMIKHRKTQHREEPENNTQIYRSQPVTSGQQNVKPITPEERCRLPKIPKNSTIRTNHTQKSYMKATPHQKSISQMEFKGKMLKQVRERDLDQQQRFKAQRQRQLELRRQTKDRLKKLQSKSIKPNKSEKIKYQNYMPKVNPKKKNENRQWKKIIKNEKISKEQKYHELMSKAASMQKQARSKENLRKQGDEDAVELYIGSIQAKLALLQKF